MGDQSIMAETRTPRGAAALAHPLPCSLALSPGGRRPLGVACGTPAVLVDRVQAAGVDSDEATARTVAVMWRHIGAAQGDAMLDAALSESQAYLPAAASDYARAWCWWWWVRTHVEFRNDQKHIETLFGEPDQLELLISPPVLLRMLAPAGDCDEIGRAHV